MSNCSFSLIIPAIPIPSFGLPPLPELPSFDFDLPFPPLPVIPLPPLPSFALPPLPELPSFDFDLPFPPLPVIPIPPIPSFGLPPLPDFPPSFTIPCPLDPD